MRVVTSVGASRAGDRPLPPGELVKSTTVAGRDGSISSPTAKSAIRLAVRVINRPRTRKSANAITADIFTQLLASYSDKNLTDIRDRAVLMV